MKFLVALLLGLPFVLGIKPACAQLGRPNAGLPVVRLTVAGHSLTAEVAATEAQRQTGLMHRFSMPADHGMLFVFPEPRPLSFWMRNTYVPLSIAYLDAQGRILNVEDMAPQDERSKHSAAPALYALEMKKGWFAQKGVRAGAKVEGLPPAAKE